MLFVMPLLQLSHHYTYQLAISSHLIFVGALPQTEKYVEQVEKLFLWNKGEVGMSPHEKEGEQEDAYTKTETHS